MSSTIVENDYEEKLINIINEISTDRLKHTSHSKYVSRIVQVTSQALKQDGTRLLMLIESIKSCPTACYKRDLLLDVLADIVTSEEILTNNLLNQPFTKYHNQSIPWKELANAIATIPDLVANCCAQTRFPKLNRSSFYAFLLDRLYKSMEYLSQEHHVKLTHRMYLVQLLGRIAISGNESLVWSVFTLKAIKEPQNHVKSFISSVFQLPTNLESNYETLELFIDRLYLPIFSNLKPSKFSGDQIYSLIGTCVLTNEHLLYLICDKSIFKTNYNLDRLKQSLILFNISAYLSSLVKQKRNISVDIDIDNGKDNEDCSLLMTTLLEIVRNWASSTKVLLRSYEHSRYITTALLILFRHALKHENRSLAEHASEILSIIVSAIPTYLNRASQDHRNLAICLGESLLPELRKLMADRYGREVDDKKEFDIDWNVDRTDDLLYLQQLFQQDVAEIFSGYSNDSDEAKSECLSYGQDDDSKSLKLKTPTGSTCSKQLQSITELRPNKIDTSLSNTKKRIVECLSDSYDESRSAADDDDDDPEPYVMSEDGTGEDDDDDYELGVDAANVPIYLRDCLDGLFENNNHRYVRLCLEKAGELIDQLIDQDVEARDKQVAKLANQQFEQTIAIEVTSRATANDCLPNCGATKSLNVNETIADVGVELARALLYLDNQFNINEFDAHRIKALTSLCCAAPQIVAKYLIEVLNGSNRSIQQQLDILQVLVASARRLSGHLEHNSSAHKQKEPKVTGNNGARLGQQRVNKFNPFVALYFYGIVYRLKADFVNNRSLVTPQPKSIMSAFRELESHTTETESIPHIRPARASTTLINTTTTTPITSDPTGDNVDNFLERNSVSDDSYLLSKILISTALMLDCSSQQPVVGGLATDLLDILAAYRCHPDPGVQKAMICCLKSIKDSTPRVYYENFIERRMMHLFGPWLSNNGSQTQ